MGACASVAGRRARGAPLAGPRLGTKAQLLRVLAGVPITPRVSACYSSLSPAFAALHTLPPPASRPSQGRNAPRRSFFRRTSRGLVFPRTVSTTVSRTVSATIPVTVPDTAPATVSRAASATVSWGRESDGAPALLRTSQGLHAMTLPPLQGLEPRSQHGTRVIPF